MTLRVIFCLSYVVTFSVLAWRNWFLSLCAAIGLMAFLEHPDMPKSIGGIQGLNPWNFLMANVLLAWITKRRREGLRWDMPASVNFFLFTYFCVILWGFYRLATDHEELKLTHNASEGFIIYSSFFWAVSEYLINCIKWVLPGLLLYDACRTRQRVVFALFIVLGVYFLLALQVIQHSPISAVAASGAELSRHANRVLARTVGYHRVNLSMMLSGASWAILTTLALAQGWRERWIVVVAAGLTALGQALTGGRAGYLSWGLLGMILCLVRWRRLFVVFPVVVAAILVFMPGVSERMLQGFGSKKGVVREQNDAYEMTSGRNIAWAYVIRKIHQDPVFGFGRQAMVRTGIYQEILEDSLGGETFPHPHNAYLECLLDNGVVGFLLIIPLYLIVLWHAFMVLLDRSDPVYAAVGGTACALVLALLIAAMGSQSFYPREGSVGMWAAIGIMLRVSTERRRARASGIPLFGTRNVPRPRDEWQEAIPA